MKRRIIAIVLMLLILNSLTGCNNKENESVDVTEAAEDTAVLGVGETGKTENFSITITKVEKAKKWINSPPEGKEYVVVSFKFTNTSSEEQSISESYFQYVDAQGNRNAPARTTGIEAEPATFGGASIGAGDSFEGSIIYDIPIDLSMVELHYLEGYNPDPLLIYQFSK